jgi:hypothetical protein
MNRFPIPVLPATSLLSTSSARYSSDTSRSSGFLATKKTGWGPNLSVASFAQDAAAAEARERLLFFDTWAGVAF